MNMTILAGMELALMILSEVAKAKKEGRDTFDLMQQAKQLDDDSRAALVGVIAQSEQSDQADS